MLKNYIKTAWRNLLKNKFYSFINIAGLTAGLAIGILILLWVQDELSYDSFHKKAANIYRLETSGGTGASVQIFTSIVAPMAPVSTRKLPDIQDYVRLTPAYNFTLYKFQDKVFADEKATYADPSLFKIFDFPIIKGNPAKPFTDDNSVVITKETAEKYFGAADPIGKVIIADDRVNFTVSAVVNNFPKNSSINYDMIMPMSFHIKFMLARHVDLNTNFDFYAYETYLLLRPGTNPKSLVAPLQKIHLSFRPEDTDGAYLLLPIAKMHLYNADLTDKGITTVRIFVVIALLILVIACINYVNLSTARSMLRSKEISMRKIVGAAKAQLFMQFIIETALLFLIASLLAFGLIFILMQVFNQVSGKQLVFNPRDYHIWLIVLSAITGTLAASSIYPALLLSSFDPLKALKGKISAGIGDVLFRKILVVTQFTFSVVLIVGTIVITNQLNYIRSKQLGYDKSHTLAIWMRRMGPQYDAVKAELLKQPGVLAITRANSNIVNMPGFNGDNDWEGKLPGQVVIVHEMVIDKDFIPFFKIKILQGAGFTGAIADSGHFILNETAVRELGMKNPIGQRFRMFRTKGTIIGVVKDFHFASMKEKIGPAVFHYNPHFMGTMYIKTEGRDARKVIASAAKQFKQYNGQFPFSYAFLDDTFNSLYQSEQHEGTLFNYFAAIAIFISCLGLLGLAAYTGQVRTREIGVRKVLGASVSGIVTLLAKDFVKLVFIAIAIATPLGWFAMHKWLQAFAYRVDIGWWVFALAAFVAVIVAFATISLQSVKVALMNPIKSLRSE